MDGASCVKFRGKSLTINLFLLSLLFRQVRQSLRNWEEADSDGKTIKPGKGRFDMRKVTNSSRGEIRCTGGLRSAAVALLGFMIVLCSIRPITAA